MAHTFRPGDRVLAPTTHNVWAPPLTYLGVDATFPELCHLALADGTERLAPISALRPDPDARTIVSLSREQLAALRAVLTAATTPSVDGGLLLKARLALMDNDDTCQVCARHYSERHTAACPPQN